MSRKYVWDWLAVLLLMVVLVITEELKPFERSIYHESDQVSTWCRLQRHGAVILHCTQARCLYAWNQGCQHGVPPDLPAGNMAL